MSGYIDASYTLDADEVCTEYRSRVASAPTRTQPYIVEHDITGRADGSNRLEELLAHRMYLEQTALLIPGWPSMRIVDFQTPLNSKRSDGLGEVDLLAAGDGLAVVELKVLRPDGGADTPLNALLEAIGYCAVVEANQDRIVDDLAATGHRVGSDGLCALVLAPEDYWARWDRTRTTQPWRDALTHAAGVISDATGLRVGYGSFDMDDVAGTLDVTDPTV